jgi:hypothetical protein
VRRRKLPPSTKVQLLSRVEQGDRVAVRGTLHILSRNRVAGEVQGEYCEQRE